MDITIIQFSPSGNTARVAGGIADALRKLPGMRVQLVDITGDELFFSPGGISRFLESRVSRHDLLLIAAPVYAHHLQYHMKNLLAALPRPDGKTWGDLAIPCVTYGGISSGIALEEASDLLHKSGRRVAGGVKVSASHRMTRAFLDTEFNAGKPGAELAPVIGGLMDLIAGLSAGKTDSAVRRKLRYQSRLTRLVCDIVFDEKKWHRKRYPKVVIDRSACSSCGKCAAACPVRHLEFDAARHLIGNDQNGCIHCLNCVTGCPINAVSLAGDLEKGKRFMTRMIRRKGNTETPATALLK